VPGRLARLRDPDRVARFERTAGGDAVADSGVVRDGVSASAFVAGGRLGLGRVERARLRRVVAASSPLVASAARATIRDSISLFASAIRRSIAARIVSVSVIAPMLRSRAR
jgi:hypothetical protein